MEAGGRGKGKINSNQQDPHLARRGVREINNTLSSALGGLRKLPSRSLNINLAPQTFYLFIFFKHNQASSCLVCAFLKALTNMMMACLVMPADTSCSLAGLSQHCCALTPT